MKQPRGRPSTLAVVTSAWVALGVLMAFSRIMGSLAYDLSAPLVVLSLPILFVKYCCYWLWCAIGVRITLDPEQRRDATESGLLAALALVFGLPNYILLLRFGPDPGTWLGYLGALLPLSALRWCEWGLIEAMLPGVTFSPQGLIVGARTHTRLWRLGGVVVSALSSDLLMFLMRDFFGGAMRV
jgi:hypothetical protein